MIMKGLKDRITLFRPAMRHRGFLSNQTPQQLEETRAELKQCLNQIMEMVENQSFDMIVMDELLDVLHTGLIPESHICSLIYQNPSEWVLTGRTASETLMNQADYITRMEPVRHPFQKGLKARQGIEY